MREPPARVWLRQARSDRDAAERSVNLGDPSTFCHAIAKYQQVVEKAVKSIAAASNQAARSPIKIGFSHSLDRIISSLVRIPRGPAPTDLSNRLRRLLDETTRGDIEALMNLAPRQPEPGGRARRNTEYPFQDPEGSWVAPCDVETFDRVDLDRFRRLSHRILNGSDLIVSALERHP